LRGKVNVRSKNFFRLVTRSIVVAFCCFQAAYPLSQSDVRDLHRVKKIYIQAVPNVKEEMKIEPFLKIELKKNGFEIVGDVSKGDATLSGEIQAEIVLDGDGSVPNKSIYLYQLTLPTKIVIWKSKVKFSSKPSFAEDNEYAATKIAEKLVMDWQKAAKKAGAQ
jgi:hypothetical protein